MREVLIVLFFVSSLISLSGTAISQSELEAHKLFLQGTSAFQQGKYKEALGFFEKSLTISKNLNLLKSISFNLSCIGMTYESLGHHEKALSFQEEALKIFRELKIPQYIAMTLSNIGRAYKSLNQYKKALTYYEQGLKINRETSNTENIAKNLNSIGLIYYSLGQHEKALSYFEESLKIRRDLNNPKDIAATLDNIGGVYKSLGQYEKALSHYEESLKIRKDLNNPKNTATILNNIGIIYRSLGQYKKALSYLEEALKIVRGLNILRNIAASLNNIGLVYSSLGQYEKALSYFEESLKIRRDLNNPKDTATILNNIGDVYHSLGQYEKALSYYEESLKIKRELNNPKDLATSLNNIGLVYSSLGHYEKALSNLEEALKMVRGFNILSKIAATLNNIGGVYSSLGQYEKALSCHEESLIIERELNIPQSIARGLNNIGLIYSSLGHYEKAISCNEESLKIFKVLNISNYIAASLYNIGSIYLSQKKYKESEESFLEAEKEEKKTGYERGGNPGLVEVYIITGKYDNAFSLLNNMKPKWNASYPHRIQYHTQLGLALKGIGSIKEASHEFFKAVSISEEMRQRIKKRTGFLSAGGYGGRVRSYRGLVTALSERAINGEKKDDLFSPYGNDISSSAFYFAESTKARVLLESMAESEKQKRKMKLPETVRKKEQNLLNQLSTIESHWEEAYKKGKEAFSNLQERKKNLTAELNNLIKELKGTHPRYAALYYPMPISPEELPLNDNEVLVEYALGDDAGYVSVVRKGGVKNLIKIPKEREALEKKVKAFMEPLNSNLYWNFSVAKAKDLYDIFLSDALKEIKEDEKIIIIPDGILGLLPFEALVVNAGTDVKDSLFVGDKYNLSYYQSATVMAFQRRFERRKAEKILFALGNPVYSEKDRRYIAFRRGQVKSDLPTDLNKHAYHALATRREWGKTKKDDSEGKELTYTPLPETEVEVRAIAQLFGIQPAPPDVLLSVQANETELRNVNLDKYRYIHFATHADLPGRIQGINEPFILLGQVENKGKDDGFLTMSEVLSLELNADLVVLSSCVTGVGKQMEGEGVANFARAFQYAGAESVVVSLWEVVSKEAVEYMKTFYGYLKDGKDRGEALRLARKEIKSIYPNPYFWAPFILHGER